MPVEAKETAPGFVLGERDQLLDRLDAELGRHHQHLGDLGDQRHRREIAQRIVRHALNVRRYRYRARRGEEQRIAVGVGLGDVVGADGAGGAGPVLDIDALAERRRHLVGDQAADEIGRSPGREGDHDADRPGRIIILRLRGRRAGRGQRRAYE